MKSNLNILNMNRDIFCFKFIGVLTVISLFLGFSTVNAQNDASENNYLVKGIVLDANSKKPVNAAQISITNKNISAVTDENGLFSLKTASLKDVMTVSAYDYNSREIPLRGNDSIVIYLYSNQFKSYFKTLKGLTGTVKNTELTSSVKSVENNGRSNLMVADDIIQSALGGDVRSITRSGTDAIGSSLFIRGMNSLNANAQPLFVVDGIVWENLNDVNSIHQGFFSDPLANIDVNDIADISVIKDGTSIYGSKGANGVVIINTKRATSMVTKISLNVLTGVTTQPSSIPTMNTENFRIYANDMLGSKGVSSADATNYSFLVSDPSNPVYNRYHNNTNWANEIYQNGITNSYLINADGGDEKAMYYFSLGYTANSGVVKTTDFQRINARFNADIKLIDNFTMGMNIGFSRIERNLLDDGINSYTSPTWISAVKAPFLSPYAFTAVGEKTTNFAYADDFDVSNPNGVIYSSINNLKNYRFNISVKPEYKINKEFTVSTLFDYNINKTSEGHYIPAYFSAIRYIEDYGYSYNEISSQVMRSDNYFNETQLTYNKKFDSLNSLKAMYGWRYINNTFESDYAEEHNTGSNNNTTITGDHDFLQVSGINNHVKSISNYVNVDFDHDNRYYLNVAMSLDASSRFGRKTLGGINLFGRSWGVFPSINGAWLVSSEKFMKDIKFVDYLKLRAGYGITGNDDIKDYESMAYFAAVRFYDKANGLVLSNIENTKVQWETTGKANVAFDLGLFNDILNLSVDLYSSKTSNLLVLKDLPEITGLGKYWTNSGEMTNKGYEISANVKALNLKDLKWELGLSVGHYNNKITALPEGEFTSSVYEGEVISRVGEAAGSFYGYKTNGVFATQDEADLADLKIKNADGTYSQFNAGDIIFQDVADANGVKDGIIDEMDKQIIGNPNPDVYGSVSSKLSFKRFTLNTIFTYCYGNDVYNYYRSQLEAGKDFNNQSNAMLTRWTADGQITNQPKATYGDPMGNARFSDRWIEDGSYIRLKTLSLSYDLPLKSNYIQGLSIWLSANNLLTFTNYLGLDPEFSTNNSVYYQGVDAGLLPLTKSYYVGVKINL